MKTVKIAAVLLFTGCVGGVPVRSTAASGAPSAQDAAQADTVQQRMPFRRRSDGSIPHHPTRTFSHERSASVESHTNPKLYVLLPEEVAITTEAQPSLFWYLSKPVDSPVKLTITTPNHIDPVLELDLDMVKRPGIQRLDLSKLPVRLKPAVRYDWVVAIADKDGKSSSVYAKSVVWRINATDALATRLAHAGNRRQRAAIAAEEGLWIDALAGISNLIDHKPNDSSLRNDRADLLRQVGFKVVINSRPGSGYVERVDFHEPVRVGRAD